VTTNIMTRTSTKNGGLYMMKAILFLCLFFTANAMSEPIASDASPSAEKVIICLDSETEWPPYSYHPLGEDGEVDSSRHVGASVDLIEKVFSVIDIDFEVRQMPWPRVLAALKGIDGTELCEVTWDTSVNEERLSWLMFTEPIYKIHSGGFYNKEKLPDLDSFWGLAQLFSYNMCGIRGYDYSPIDGLLSTLVAREQQALDLVALGRCDIFVSTIEPIVYGAKLGLYKMDENTVHLIGKGFDRIMHAAVSKASPRAKELHNKISNVLGQLRKSGEIERIFVKYLPSGTGF